MEKPKKILMVGEGSYWDRSRSYKQAFKSLGFNDVKIIDIQRKYSVSLFNRILNKIILLLGNTPIFFGVSRLNLNIIREARKFNPDFIFFLKPIFIKKSTIARLKEQGIIVFSWHTDDAFNPRNSSWSFYKSVSLYDCCFTTKSFNVDEFLEAGAQKSVFLPHAVNSNLHHPIKVSKKERKKLGADVVFIGTYANDKRVKYTEKLCEDGYNIKIYGSSWDKLPQNNYLHKRTCIQNKPVYGEKFCRVINSSKIILAFLRAHNRDVQTSRTYEIPACKGFMLHERTNEATNLFKEGKEAEFFGSYQELKEKIDYYLSHSKQRRKIAEEGYKKATNYEYSYEARAEKILEVYNSLKNNV